MAGVVASLWAKLGLDTKEFSRGIKRTQTDFGKLKKGITGAQTAMIALATSGFVYGAKKAFDLGAAVEETGSKFNTVFGPARHSVQAFVDDFASMAGLSETAAKEVVATTGAIVQGMGLAQEASAKYAEQVVRLAGDLSSFNNIPIEETSRAIQAAITGEREQLKRLGIVILETDVQKRALAETGKTVVGQLTQEEKAMATLQLITERAGVAVGDLERTQGSAANRARKLAAEFKTMAEQMANALMPAFNVLLERLTETTAKMQTSKDVLREIGESIAVVVQAVVTVVSTVANTIELILDGAVKTIVELLAFALDAWNGFAQAVNDDIPNWVPFELATAENAFDTLAGMSREFAVDMSGDIDDVKKAWADLWAVMMRDAAPIGGAGAAGPGLGIGAGGAGGAAGGGGGEAGAGFKTLDDVWQKFPGVLLQLQAAEQAAERQRETWAKLGEGVTLSTNSMQYFAERATAGLDRARNAALGFGEVFANALVDSTTRGKQAFTDFANHVIREFQRILAQRAVFAILNWLLPGAGTIAGTVTSVINRERALDISSSIPRYTGG